MGARDDDFKNEQKSAHRRNHLSSRNHTVDFLEYNLLGYITMVARVYNKTLFCHHYKIRTYGLFRYREILVEKCSYNHLLRYYKNERIVYTSIISRT